MVTKMYVIVISSVVVTSVFELSWTGFRHPKYVTPDLNKQQRDINII